MLLDNNLNKERVKGEYNPTPDEQDAINYVSTNLEIGNSIRESSYEEFNGLTLLQRQKKDQRAFNVWQERRDTGDDGDWKSNAVRPIERNRIIRTLC